MTTSAPHGWRWALPCAAVAVALGASTAGAAPPGSAAQVRALLGDAAPVGVELDLVDALTRPPQARLPRAASVHELEGAVAASARALGVPVPAASPALVPVPPTVRGGLVQALDVLSSCAATTRSAVDALGGVGGLAVAVGRQQAPDREVGARLQACAVDLRRSLADLELAMRRAQPAASVRAAAAAAEPAQCPAPAVSLWPVLALDLSVRATCYHRDYALVVDQGGDDLYDNNAGGNLLDLQPERERDARARGCRHAIPGLVARDCTPLAAALLDLAGNDDYGVLEEPFGDLPALVPPVDAPPPPVPDPFLRFSRDATDRPGDAHCTKEPVVARLMTQGAGFLGVGMLVDVHGDDVYDGKTGSQGAGHVGGVGLLQDTGGADRYTAVRNSQGFGLLGGAGVLADTAGDDVYAFRMPAPRQGVHKGELGEAGIYDLLTGKRNPLAGIGGVVDDDAHCDNIPRFVQGAANLASLGVLVDAAGQDSYTGAGAPNGERPDIAVPLGDTTGSQGFGSQGAVGVLLDLSGSADRYAGQPGRGDGTAQLDCADGGAGVFADAGPVPAPPASTGTCVPATAERARPSR